MARDDRQIDTGSITARLNAGDVAGAEKLCIAALLDDRDAPDLWRLLGGIRHRKGDAAGAVQAFERVVALTPGDAEGWASLGVVAGMAGRAEAAAHALRQALDRDPGHGAARQNLALTLMRLRRPAEAVPLYRQIADAAPDAASSWTWLGHALAAAGDAPGAQAAYGRALALDPKDRNTRLTLALVERDLGRIPASTHLLDALLDEAPGDPVARFARAQNLLLSGDFARGFADFEARWQRPGMQRPAFPFPPWQGEDVTGRHLLLHDEQGLGDTIQFARFAPMLAARGARVTLAVRPRLLRLMKSLPPSITVTGDGAGVRADCHAPLMSVPHLARLFPPNLPETVPYLAAEPDLLDIWRPRIEQAAGAAVRRIGLIWQGNPDAESDRGRSLTPDVLLPLLDLPGTHFFILQSRDGRDDVEYLSRHANVTDLGEELDNGNDAFTDTAAVMSLLDAVVTSDTGPAHLAGALGVPTLVMLKHVPEWRWGSSGERTPWYPSMRLVRQTIRGDWHDCVARVRRHLAN